MTAALNGATPHKHNGVAGDPHCPTCNSVISPELYEAIMGELAVHDAEVVQAVEARFLTREATVRQEATAAANAANAGKLAEATEARKVAEQAAKDAKATFDTALRERLEAATEAAAKARVEAVNAVTEKFFGENLRLQERVLELQRMLEKKTANELGDAGEIDLFELLMAEFPADQISRVGKGVNGPDIIHRVFSGGAFTGRSIVYDSKNHKNWMSKWLPKLRRDQTEYGADHAVLVSTVFPAGKSQLLVENGVVVCSPARAAAIAHMLRRAILQTHALGLSNADRDEKTARLYDLLTSDRATERWERLSAATTELVELETSDAAHQQRVRDKRLTKVRSIVAVHDEFTGDIDCIVRGEPGDLV